MMQRRLFAAVAATVLQVGPVPAQMASPTSNTKLSKESDNPVSRMIKLPLRYVAEFDSGAYKETKDTFEIDQAIVPFRLSEDWSLVTRTKLPYEVIPPKKFGDDWTSGFSNGYTTFFLSPEHGQGFYWGVGPVLYYPSSSTAVGVTKWGSGPSVALIKKDASPWVFGAVVNNIWSFGDTSPGGSNKTNSLLLNPFISYHFDDGWSVGSSPDITANWIASGEKWTVPIGGGLSKTTRLGAQSLKLGVDAYYNAIRPDTDNDIWELKTTLTLLFPD